MCSACISNRQASCSGLMDAASADNASNAAYTSPEEGAGRGKRRVRQLEGHTDAQQRRGRWLVAIRDQIYSPCAQCEQRTSYSHSVCKQRH